MLNQLCLKDKTQHKEARHVYIYPESELLNTAKASKNKYYDTKYKMQKNVPSKSLVSTRSNIILLPQISITGNKSTIQQHDITRH